MGGYSKKMSKLSSICLTIKIDMMHLFCFFNVSFIIFVFSSLFIFPMFRRMFRGRDVWYPRLGKIEFVEELDNPDSPSEWEKILDSYRLEKSYY